MALYVLYLCLLCELSARLFLAAHYGVPLLRPATLIYKLYPQLAMAHQQQGTAAHELFDILLLGGSVLNRDWSDVEQLLGEELQRRGSEPFRIFNMAQPAHTSLDSLYKYRRLDSQRFDLVIVYHGINDIRANCCPDEVFQDAYQHYRWYRLTGFLDRTRQLSWLASPAVLQLSQTVLQEQLGLITPMPREQPRRDWLQHGATIKTAATFRHNLLEMNELATTRGDTLLLATFAWYLPDSYSLSRFTTGSLDYAGCERSCAVEHYWGLPQHVVTGLKVHNRIIREIARTRPEPGLVDLAQLMPAQGMLFCDICHLSPQGSRLMAHHLAMEVLQVMETSKVSGTAPFS